MKRSRLREASDGELHARITVILAPLCFLAGLILFDIDTAWLVFIGCMFGLVCGPDLDLRGISFNESIWFAIPLVGWLLGFTWQIVWYPYAYFSHHRGASHWPIIGTGMRLVYLYVASCIILTFINVAGGQCFPETWIQLKFISISDWMVPAAIGLAVSDLGHIGRDIITSDF